MQELDETFSSEEVSDIPSAPPLSGAAVESEEIKPATSSVQVSEVKTGDCVESRKTGHFTRYFLFCSLYEMNSQFAKPYSLFTSVPIDLVLLLSHLGLLINIQLGCQLFMRGSSDLISFFIALEIGCRHKEEPQCYL